MKKRNLAVLSLVLMLTIGFATISTQLTMNGSLAIGESDFKVKFNRSVLNGANRPTFINKEGNVLTFQNSDLIEVGESLLDYEVVNMSRQYDANVQVTCTTDANNVTISNTTEQVRVNSGDVTTGTIALTSTKRDEVGEVPSEAVKLYDKVKKLSRGLDTNVGLNYNKVNQKHGVFETVNTDSGESVYFYRGIVDNNIIFANKCWNIIRTTETGGVKLFYAGIPINGSCDQSNVLSGGTYNIGSYTMYDDDIPKKDLAYSGYMYGIEGADNYEDTHKNLTDSKLKTIVDKWYENNIRNTKYESMLEDTIFCNDRSIPKDMSNINKNLSNNLGYGTELSIYSSGIRVGDFSIKTKPTLSCSQLNDRFTVSSSIGNGALTYPIGLMTADEAVYAGYTGGYINKAHNEYATRDLYLSKEDHLGNVITSWTMTPSGNAYYKDYVSNLFIGFYSRMQSYASNIENTKPIGLNPVVSLNNENYVISGDGTLDNPYILFTKGSATDSITCTLHVSKIEREELGEEFDGVRSLYDNVKIASLGTDKENNIDYNKISSDTNGKGVYETSDTDSGKTVYFYRGDVEDNNVIFANKCWQVIRTTSSDGTKLIYNGEVSASGECTNEGEARAIGTSPWSTRVGDNTYTGYMFGNTYASTYETTHSNRYDSLVKSMIDTWYESNLKGTEYENLLEDVVFCNDRTVETDFSNYTYPGWLKLDDYKKSTGIGNTKAIYQGSGRVGINVGTTKPTLTCSQLNDRFTVSSSIGNGALKYPIGLMTADETVFAGATGGFQGKNTEANNFDYYLYIGGNHSWTMTPHRADTTNIMLVAGSEGNIGNEVSKTENVLVRPVITIRNDVMIVDGNGSKISPHILKTR